MLNRLDIIIAFDHDNKIKETSFTLKLSEHYFSKKFLVAIMV